MSVFGLERARELASASHENARRGARRRPAAELAGDTSDLELMTDFMYREDELT